MNAGPRISKPTLLGAIALLALTFLAYAPAMTGGFIWDDDDYVTQNVNLRSAEGFSNIWLTPRSSPQYYPLVHSSFWIEHHLWRNWSPGYHIVNILLQAIAAILLWRLLVALDLPAALLAACVFAIHPLQAESVAWITERKNVLSAVFYFAAALLFVAWASRPSEVSDKRSGETPKPRSNLYAFALLCFIAAMLSKTVACSLPAALALILWWKNNRVTPRQWLALAPMFAIGLALAICTALLERSHVQAVGREWNFSILDRILIAGRAVWHYAGTFLLPINLSFIYPKWLIDPAQAWQWAFPVGVIVALVTLYLMRNRWGRGPLVAALIYVGTLVPALGFFNIYPMRYSFVADHFQYHALAALAILATIGLTRLLGKSSVIILIPLLILTMIRAHILADSERLWRDAAAKNPTSWMVRLNLARTLAERGKDDEANENFALQAQLAPDLPETHWNLGVNYSRRGLLDQALAEYDRAIAIDDQFPQAYFGRGNVLLQQGKIDEAIAQFTRAIEFKPDYAMAHNELGQLLMKQKRPSEALEHYLAAVKSDPALAKARVNLAALLAAMGKTDEAIEQFDAAVRIDPSLEQYRSRVLGAGF